MSEYRFCPLRNAQPLVPQDEELPRGCSCTLAPGLSMRSTGKFICSTRGIVSTFVRTKLQRQCPFHRYRSGTSESKLHDLVFLFGMPHRYVDVCPLHIAPPLPHGFIGHPFG